MGTNYYVKSACGHRGQHIGKLSGQRPGLLTFIWAVEPSLLGEIAAIESETGYEWTRNEFAALLDTCHTHDHDFIGTEFS